jgi:predicted transglutaminase-like cysteine proteinase
MRLKKAAGAALCALLCWAGPEAAMSKNGKEDHATTYGKASPPIGYVDFCARQPKDCKATGAKASPFKLTAERWNLLFQVNTFVNGKITPVSDLELYGEPEHWTYPSDAGDCEDYLLLKKKYLEGLGFPASSLLITVVLDEKQEGHAVLTVSAEEGDFILDNRRNEILNWKDTSYKFLKRQSAAHPQLWLSMTKQANQQQGALGGSASSK